MIDLHIHTKYSDGQYEVSELIDKMRKVGIKTFAFTDHDIIDGCIEFDKIKHLHTDFNFIAGVELDAIYNDLEIHILGYGFDVDNKELNSLVCDAKRRRRQRMGETVDILRDRFGIKISQSKVESLINSKTSVGRPEIAREMVNMGVVKSIKEAFDKYLANIKLPNIKTAAQTAINIVKQAGGLSVFAHPWFDTIKDREFSWEQLESLIRELKALGLDGIECYHSGHSREVAKKLIEIAERNNLLISAGSDFHGEEVIPSIKLGTVSVEGDSASCLQKISVLSRLIGN